jgi:hypothetical protein
MAANCRCSRASNTALHYAFKTVAYTMINLRHFVLSSWSWVGASQSSECRRLMIQRQDDRSSETAETEWQRHGCVAQTQTLLDSFHRLVGRDLLPRTGDPADRRMAHIITATNFGKRLVAITAPPDRLSRV